MKIVFTIIMLLSLLLLPIASYSEDEDLLSLLKAQKFELLESSTRHIQSEFENGVLTEIQLRTVYRQFYNLKEDDLAKVEEWKRTIPASYAAHLILGTYYKRKGNEARGTEYIPNTPREKIEKMHYYHEIGKPDLDKSLKLTGKPYLSVFHLLDIARLAGNHADSWALVQRANAMLPTNTLARNRFFISLEPRWGGSYGEMRSFIARSKEEGISRVGIMELEAIMYDDMGYTYWERGEHQSATHVFGKALDLAESLGRLTGAPAKDFVVHAFRYACEEPVELKLKNHC